VKETLSPLRTAAMFVAWSRSLALALLLLVTLAAAVRAANVEWSSVQGSLANQRHAPIDQINRSNVSRLGAAWTSDAFEDGATSRMTPLVHDGLMFLAAGSRVFALDARDGKRVWVHQTETRTTDASRWQEMFSGLAITRSWGLGLGGGLVYAGLLNGHIVALDEKTGALVWDQIVNPEPLKVSRGVICTPLYVDGVLYLGLGMETTEGHIIAVDAKTGRVLWRVGTVAEPGQPGHDSWPAQSEVWRFGGGHSWTSGAADPAAGLVYFGTGNAAPAHGGGVRPGDNLYTVSIVALELKTGRMRWYRQLIHHDLWEADLSVPPVLFEAKIKGHIRHAIATMRGDGYLFIFDRLTGEPLIPIEERAVRQSASLRTSPTQPFPAGGDTVLPPCESWRAKLPAGFVLGCMFDPPASGVPNQLVQWPSFRLAAMSYDPRTSLIIAQGQNSLLWRKVGPDPYIGYASNNTGEAVPGYPRATVAMAAIDTRTDRVVWRKELPSYDESGYRADGGALTTSGGLLFHQGGDGTLQAYDTGSGELLWKFQTDYAVGDAPPMSYSIDHKQYVAFVAGTRVWAFALDGKIPQSPPPPPPDSEEFRGAIVDAQEVETMTMLQTPSNGHRYFMDEYAFNPFRVRIPAGSSVTFINNGQLAHTIAAVDGSWTTGTLGPTEIKSVPFTNPGSYLYTSKEFPWSYGQIIVVPASHDAADTNSAQVRDQVEFGKAAFSEHCASCHGERLEGRDRTPALAGNTFQAAWRGRDEGQLFDRIKTTMPSSSPGSLTDEQYAALVAYIVHANGGSTLDVLRRSTIGGNPVIK
jgi:quinohemoprotein ethanol dehydrogenase